ncbi:GGDEF domain-containing protein [Hoeflea sp.]|uniref:GGDEF domain-containing protein n=1 Tax=Hoeflea sp. TaxID=1940281 RepID=UPI0019C6602B|nr:GGDEF domain-containing protein [Hoeflea sp.]MBC7282967.1 GGDEF domain-containing protein [Hoeflea sp.]
MDILVYVPPALFAFMAIAFFVLWRLKIATSWQWSAGFAQTGAGFAFSAFPISPGFDAFVSGMIFIGAAYCYTSAILLHFNAPMRRLERRLFVLAYTLAHTYIVFVTADLRDELFLTDVSFACLLGLALYVVTPTASRPADKILIGAAAIVFLDTIARAIFFYFFVDTSDKLADFVTSDYNLAVHITTITICTLFPFAALGAMASAAIDRHRDAAERDPLTGLLNRRGFHKAVTNMLETTPLRGAVLVCDIDHFKQVNDKYGHAVGDKVIVAVANELQQATSSSGYAARFGGEEFVVFLPAAALEDAAAIAQLLRVSLAERAWGCIGMDQGLTASFGVSAIEGQETSALPAIERADRALYSAKTFGRNRVVVAPSPKFTSPLLENAGTLHHPPIRLQA